MTTMIHILYEDNTLGTFKTEKDTLTIHDIRQQFPELLHNNIAIIPKSEELAFPTDQIQLIIVLQHTKTSYPETRYIPEIKETSTLIYPITITPQTQSPAAWETSATAMKAEVTLITSETGEKKSAIYIHKAENSFTGNNALIPLSLHDYIIMTKKRQLYYTTDVYRIQNFNIEEKTAILEKLYVISDNPITSQLSYDRAYMIIPHLRSAIKSSKRKVRKGKTSDIHYAKYQHLLK